MRLIDADNIRVPNDSPYKGALKRLIEQQPIAYDTNKVIERLQHAQVEILDEVYSFFEQQMINAEDALEIVRAGGVNEH